MGSIGGLAAGGLNGARYGGLAGIAGGVAWALLKHGPDVKLEVGTSIEMEIQRPIAGGCEPDSGGGRRSRTSGRLAPISRKEPTTEIYPDC